MCAETKGLRKRSQNGSAQVKQLQPYAKSPVGDFSAKTTSPKKIIQKHDKIDACKYLVAQVGLENFIRSIVAALDLKLPNAVRFNMNGQAVMHTWEDVYTAEKVYTQCLGISKRVYQSHAYTHELEKKMAYFVLEEHNERSSWILPGFDFYVLVFCHYNEKKEVTAVDVQYDQMSFFLHCMGVAQAHAWFMEHVITPIAVAWAKAYRSTGLVNPFTFMLQLVLFPVLVMYCRNAMSTIA